jgi:uncharacterized protein (TIGR03083 family)
MSDPITAIRRESAVVARIADGVAPDAPVPSCPAWALRDLVVHLGAVQRFWAANIRARDPSAPNESSGDPDDPAYPRPADADLGAWMQASTDELVAAIEHAPADAPCWTWWGSPATAGAVARHQVQEAAVHRWDAESAGGTPGPIDPELAADAVDEFLAISLGDALDELQGSVTITASDTDASWTVGRDGGPVTDIVGGASDLLLVLYHRVGHDEITIEGDSELAATFLGLASTE